MGVEAGMVEKRSFLQTAAEFGNLYSRPEGGGPMWERKMEENPGKKRKRAEELLDEGTDVGRKVNACVGGEEGKNRRKDNRHRKGAWSVSWRDREGER